MTPAPQQPTRRGGRTKPTHCPSGHPYSPENTGYRANGVRVCRTCNRERQVVKRREAGARERDTGNEWWVDLTAAIVEQARVDYRRGIERASAKAYLDAAGLLTPDGKLRRRPPRSTS